MARRFLLPGTLGALLLLAAPAAAQDVAAAEVLFNKGVADMDAGRYDAACPALAESQRLDPRPGTQFALADCNAKAGKIATAVALYEDYQRAVSSQPPAIKQKHADRLRIARAQLDKLRPAVPTLTLVLPASAPADARVRRDGIDLAAAALGVALPVDPGEHVVVVEAQGRRPSEQRFTLERGQKKSLELTVGGAAEAAPSATTAPEAASGPGSPPGQAQRISGYVVGGVGAATLLMGVVTGAMTLAKKGTITANCSDTVCNHDGKLAADSAKTTGLVSTVGWSIGLAGLATGTILLLTSPKPKADEKAARYDVQIAPGSLAVSVRGVW